MGKYDGQVTLAEMQEHEKQEQRYTGYDIRIDHRDAVEEGDGLPAASAHIVNSYRRHSSQQRGNQSCHDCYEEGIFNRGKQRSRTAHLS